MQARPRDRMVAVRKAGRQRLAVIGPAAGPQLAPQLVHPVQPVPSGIELGVAFQERLQVLPAILRHQIAAHERSQTVAADPLDEGQGEVEPARILAGPRRHFPRELAHQRAASRRLDHVHHRAKGVGAEHVRCREVERAQARHVHVDPDAADVVQQLDSEQVGEGGVAAGSQALQWIVLTLAEHRLARKNFRGVPHHHPRPDQLRRRRLVSPQMEFVAVLDEGVEGQPLEPR